MVVTTILDKIYGEKLKNQAKLTKRENFDICFSVRFDHYCEKSSSRREIGDTITCTQIQLSNFIWFSSFPEVLSLNLNKAGLFKGSFF